MISKTFESIQRYRTFAAFLKEKYKMKVYKLPLNYPGTCPNRDSSKGTGGCIYCGEEAAGFELLDEKYDITKQLDQNSQYIGNKYKAVKFIAYLQNHTATYMPIEDFSKIINTVAEHKTDICAIYISTRPDCVGRIHLDILKEINKKYGIDCVIELGLQSGNEKTLKILNRKHSIKDFENSAALIHSYGFDVCAHLIIDLPYDDISDIKNTARLINENNIQQVKCHSLYILKNTYLGELYQKNEFMPVSYEEYLERMVLFIRCVDEKVIFQRLTGRAPEERTLFCNFGKSWWKMRDDIISIMDENNYYQGDLHTG